MLPIAFADYDFFVDCSKYNFGTMPVLEIDGVFISQTMAILRYLGKELGTYNYHILKNYKIG